METVSLGNTGRSTSRLGFGCSSVMGGLGHRESLQMLEAAFDAGIRHFDIAPMYGYGDAEACLGYFMSRHKGQVTVTTKFGIPPAAGGALARMARSVARPVARQVSSLRQSLGRGAPSFQTSFPPAIEAAPESRQPNPIFCVEEARKSLHRSLAELRTDHIDVWLLHEVTANDLQDDELLRFLQDSVQSGMIGTFGAGSDRNQIDALLQLHPGYCPTLQYEWSVFNPLPSHSGAFRIHHRSLTNNFRSLHAGLLKDKERCARWSQPVGADLSDAATLARLMLKAALLLNPESIVLFSSKRADHIRDNVALASDASWSAEALSLYRVLQAELVHSG